MNQPQPVVSTQGTHRQKKVDEGEKDAQSYDDVDDFDNRLEPMSHKENPEYVDDDDDDDDKEEEKELTDNVSLLTPTTSKAPHKDDAFHSQHHDDHQDDDAPPEGEKRVKRQKTSKKETTINEDEVILEDETPELITEFQNVDKRVPTIFDRARMEATLNDMLSNQFKNAEEYAYHLEQATNFIENHIVWESRQEDIRRLIPRPLVFFGPQRNPNEPPRTRSSNFRMATPFANPERQFRTRRDTSLALIHNIYTFYESESSESKSEDVGEIDIETLTLEHYLNLNNTHGRISNLVNATFEIKGQL
ncbi:hypothetical protein Tco_1342277 [Tanacetum coccineum]